MRGKDLGLFPFVHMRIDFVVDEAAQRLLDLEVLVGVLHAVVSNQSFASPPCLNTRGVSAR